MISVYCAVEAVPVDREFVAVLEANEVRWTFFATTEATARKKAEAFHQAAIVEKVTGSKLKARIKELEGTTL